MVLASGSLEVGLFIRSKLLSAYLFLQNITALTTHLPLFAIL